MLAESDFNLAITLAISALAFVIALYFDLRFQRIPNLFCLFMVVLGLSLQLYLYQLNGLLNAFLGLGLAFILLFPAFLIKAIGAGDVKLMMAIGTITGYQLLIWSIVYAVIAGVITSIIYAIYKTGWTGFKATLVRYYHCFYLKQYFKPSTGEAAALRVPYAPALAIGWLWACSQNDEVLWAISNVRYAIFS